jgi:hypothetical protein
LNNSEHPQQTLLSLIRKRSLVRVQAGPLGKNPPFCRWNVEHKKRTGTKTGPCYTNCYTNALRKRLLHGLDRAVLHVGQDVAIGVERYRYGRVPQHLGDDLGVHVLEQQYGRGSMA